MIPIFFSNRSLSYLSSILAIVFGAIALFFPSLTIAGLGIIFAIAVLIGGILMIIVSQQQRADGAK